MRLGSTIGRQSLRFRLSLSLSIVIFLTALLAGCFAYYSARNAANEFLDDHLRQVATLANQSKLTLFDNPAIIREDLLDPEDSVMLVQMLGDPVHRTRPGMADLPNLPDNLPDGIQSHFLGGENWRVFVYSLNTGKRVAIAQRMRERDEIAHSSAIDTVLPLLLLIPALGILIALIIPHQLAPVVSLSRDLDTRTDSDLGALNDKDIPQEILPLTNAISRLLQRVERTLNMQRRFIADAAHELRSPLTALVLQAQRLDRGQLPTEMRPQMDALNQGLQRTRALLDQLLSLARSQTTPSDRELISVHSVFRRTIEDYASIADAHDIDIGVREEPDVMIEAASIDLHTLVRNLVDNAIRYSPDGSMVDMSVTQEGDHTVIEVSDNGPGIPVTERERVLDPFYRIVGTEATGSGLGLSIVKNIIERLGGKLTLLATHEDSDLPGLRVIVRLPGGTSAD